jgi:hypothetical protein
MRLPMTVLVQICNSHSLALIPNHEVTESWFRIISDADHLIIREDCRVFTELGESFLIRIVFSPPAEPHFSLPILVTVLLCCQHPDNEMPDVTFNLWYR